MKVLRPKIKRDWGMVADRDNRKPLSATVVRIFESTFNKLVDQQVTNNRGQYGFLVSGGRFYLTYSKSGYQEKQSEIVDFTGNETRRALDLNVYLVRQD